MNLVNYNGYGRFINVSSTNNRRQDHLGHISGSICFSHVPHESWIYWMRPKMAAEAKLTDEELDVWVTLCENSSIGKVKRISSFEEYIDTLKRLTLVDPNAKETWETGEKVKAIPFLLEKDDFINHYHQVALGMLLRYPEETSHQATICKKTVELYREYGSLYTPIQLIIFGHQYCDFQTVNINTNHTLITSGLINPPKVLSPELFRRYVTPVLNEKYRVHPLKLKWTEKYYFQYGEYTNKLKLPEFKALLDKHLDPESVKI